MDDIIIEDNLKEEVESWEPNFWQRLFSNKMAVLGCSNINFVYYRYFCPSYCTISL